MKQYLRLPNGGLQAFYETLIPSQVPRRDGQMSMLESFPAWVPGMDPQEHPKWAEQVQHERDMMMHGADAFRDRVVTATERERVNTLEPVRQLGLDWIPNTVAMLRQFIDISEKSRGVRPVALPYLKELDLWQAAAVGTRTILNGIGVGSVSLQSTALEIGSTLEHEQRIRLWERDQPELYYAAQKQLKRDKATSTHKRLVNIHTFNELLKAKKFGDGEAVARWSREVRFRVGWAVLDAIVKSTGMFETSVDHEAASKSKTYSTPLKLTFKPQLSKWFADQLRYHEANSPAYWPTLIPPRRWEGTREGGYHTPYVRAPNLIRFKASQEAQQFRAADEYDSLDMGQTMGALHLLQETPYRVNTKVLEVANGVWHGLQLSSKTLPKQKEEELPPRPWAMVEHDKLVKEAKKLKTKPPEPSPEVQKIIDEWKHQASHVYANNAQIIGRCRSTNFTMDLANDLAGQDTLYYPHKLDFRGRMYPIPGFFQPQGDDLARGLLTYATACPISSENKGDEALAIHTANQFGLDKKPYHERLQWVRDNRDLLEKVGSSSESATEYHHLWLNKETENFQALAAAQEWTAFLQHGDGFMSSLPCMVDGTCNGLQHLSALTRDEVAGAYVNLVPSGTPQDVYKYVALNVEELVRDHITKSADPKQARLAAWWLDVANGELPRSLTKRQVMVLPYGGTKDSYFGYTRDWLFGERYEVVKDLDKDFLREAVVYMANLMWSVVGMKIPGAVKVMKWLQDCASVAATNDQPIYWQVPTGFTVRHFYGLNQQKVMKSYLDGTEVKLTLNERTPKLSVKEQLQGISPNFIHSLDAACLTRTATTLAEAGITSFTSVHDAYGTHAANMKYVASHLREAFVWVHQHDLLGMFRDSCIDVLEPTLVLQGIDPMEALDRASDMIDKKAGRLDMGRLDLEGVKNSAYFFA